MGGGRRPVCPSCIRRPPARRTAPPGPRREHDLPFLRLQRYATCFLSRIDRRCFEDDMDRPQMEGAGRRARFGCERGQFPAIVAELTAEYAGQRGKVARFLDLLADIEI